MPVDPLEIPMIGTLYLGCILCINDCWSSSDSRWLINTYELEESQDTIE